MFFKENSPVTAIVAILKVGSSNRAFQSVQPTDPANTFQD